MEYFKTFGAIAFALWNKWRMPESFLSMFSKFAQDFTNHSHLRWSEVLLIFAVAVAMTVVRFVLNLLVLKPFAASCRFKLTDRPKFAESGCKVIFYSIAMVWQFYLAINKYPELMTDPDASWENWSVGMTVPNDIYYLYIYECSFYVHAIFGTIYMDVWRRDSIAMIAHHIVTDLLLIFSLAFRCHRIGFVILVLHDVADVFLESTKLLTCFKNRTKKPGMLLEGTIVFGFVMFALTWFVLRLYFYPQLALYSAAVSSSEMVEDLPLYFVFNVMLLILFVLNVYWSHFIALLIFRILTGKSRGVEDTREEDGIEPTRNSTEANGHVAKKHAEKQHLNGMNEKERHIGNGHSVKQRSIARDPVFRQ